MKIETERLEIVTLTPQQLELWINDLPKLEKDLGCSYLWHSFWFIIRKSDNVVVGSIDFKDVPDNQGGVEIGYGLGGDFEHNGYSWFCFPADFTEMWIRRAFKK